LLAAFFSAGALAANGLPRLQFGIGDVKAVSPAGKIRKLIKGDVLLPGEKMVTGHGAMAQLRIFEQGVVVLKDRGQLELKPAVNGKFTVSLDQGLMRTVTKLGYRRGKIDVATPAAEIAVQSGDVLTGVGVGKSARATTHNHVLDGKVRVKTKAGESVVDIGKIVQINPLGGVVNAVDKVPDAMQLRVPAPSAGVSAALNGATAGKLGSAFKRDRTKRAVLNPRDAPTKNFISRPDRAVSARPVSVAGLGRTPIKPARQFGSRGPKVNFDGVEAIDPRTSFGSNSDRQVVNDTLILSIPSSISNTRNFAPAATDNSKIKKELIKKARVVNLAPTASVAGETTLSSSQLPEIKVVTFEPAKIEPAAQTFDPVLTDRINKNRVNPGKTKIKPVRCKTCDRGLALIRP